jgi:hypothetical protein
MVPVSAFGERNGNTDRSLGAFISGVNCRSHQRAKFDPFLAALSTVIRPHNRAIVNVIERQFHHVP